MVPDRLPDRRDAFRPRDLVGVDRQDPVVTGVAQGLIPGIPEVERLHGRRLEDPRGVLFRDAQGLVGRPRVQDHDLIDQVDRLQAAIEDLLLVLHDQDRRDPVPDPGAGGPAFFFRGGDFELSHFFYPGEATNFPSTREIP